MFFSIKKPSYNSLVRARPTGTLLASCNCAGPRSVTTTPLLGSSFHMQEPQGILWGHESQVRCHHFSRMCFQGHASSAKETLETITEITHPYCAFGYYFVCLEVMGIKVGHYSIFPCSTVTISLWHSTDPNDHASAIALEKKLIPYHPRLLRIKGFKVLQENNIKKTI